MKVTCEKTYSNLPFAHRQHRHDGHCALIHGHNWAFKFVFQADRLDDNGFVVDFGKLKGLKQKLLERFDHTLVLNVDDPWFAHLKEILVDTKEVTPVFAKIVAVPNCGAEGLAEWLIGRANHWLMQICQDEKTDWMARNLRVVAVTVYEDDKNSATVCHE